MDDRAHQVLTELLVLRAQGGHGDAIGLLVHTWQERLLRNAKRLTGRDDAAWDVMQESWLDIARGLNRLEDPASFGPWAYKIVTRRSAKWVGREQHRRHAEQQVAIEHEAESKVPTATDVAESADEVRVALRRLPSDQQEILELRYVEEFNIDQIAEALDIAPGTVKSRLYYARQRLKDILQRVNQ